MSIEKIKYNKKNVMFFKCIISLLMEQLFWKTVSFPEGFFYEEILADYYPQIRQLAVDDTLAALKAVSYGKADAALGETAVFNYLIGKHLFNDLIVSGETLLGGRHG